MAIRTQLDLPSPKAHSVIKSVAVFGSADVDEQHPVYQEAFKVARYLAYHDKTIINGGGPGVMQAATEGAQAGGGHTLAVTFYPKDAPEFEGRYEKNVVDQEIKMKTYVERMFGLMEFADAFVIFEGGTGTLSEWATAWLLAHLYYGKHKPLILYGEFWHEVVACITRNFFIGKTEMQVFKIVKNEQELVEALNQFEAELAARMQ